MNDNARFPFKSKLLISCATMVDALKFSRYVGGAEMFGLPCRRYPVDILCTKAPVADYLEAAVVTVLQIHVTQPPGDILVFLTGQEEFEIAEERSKHRMRGSRRRFGEMIICPIYDNLTLDMQTKVFEESPKGARKVVLATNIAETSLTIDGVKYVVDSGLVKQKSFNTRTGLESWRVKPASKAAAKQRTARAGKTSPGKCFRLFTPHTYQTEMYDKSVPEIRRTNLGIVLVTLLNLVDAVPSDDFLNPLPRRAYRRAIIQIYALGALDKAVDFTKTGRRMSEFQLDPMLAKMIMASEKYKCSEEIITICAMLSVGNSIFHRPKDKQVHADSARMNFHTGNVGDHIALLKVYDACNERSFSNQWCHENYIQVSSMKLARDIRDQLVGLLERLQIERISNSEDHEAIKKAVTSGFFYHAARLQKNGSYLTLKSLQTATIHPSSGLSQVLPQWIVYHELFLTREAWLRQVIEIKPDWIVEVKPDYYKERDFTRVMPMETSSICYEMP
ncbi:unnamed protein product [Calypogeia fissa]